MNAGPGAQPQGNRPGQMTAVMRAMAVNTGPKVLRIGLVQRGRIVEERVIKQRTTVTVGQNEKNMFVIPGAAGNLPPQFKLFELLGNDYYLNFLDGMNGRVALATGITDIAALRGQAKKTGGGYQVKLTDEARGKIVVGDTTFLFQFVAPPPVQPRPQLPLAVKGGIANQIDWNLTIIAAFSFLLHFGFIGAMYSDWFDSVVNDDVNVGNLVDMMKNIPTPPPTETATSMPSAAAWHTCRARSFNVIGSMPNARLPIRASPLSFTSARWMCGTVPVPTGPYRPSSNRVKRRTRMFSPVLATASCTRCAIVRDESRMNAWSIRQTSSSVPSCLPRSGSSFDTTIGFIAAICMATLRASWRKSSVRATKSVSQFTSISTPMRASWM